MTSIIFSQWFNSTFRFEIEQFVVVAILDLDLVIALLANAQATFTGPIDTLEARFKLVVLTEQLNKQTATTLVVVHYILVESHRQLTAIVDELVLAADLGRCCMFVFVVLARLIDLLTAANKQPLNKVARAPLVTYQVKYREVLVAVSIIEPSEERLEPSDKVSVVVNGAHEQVTLITHLPEQYNSLVRGKLEVDVHILPVDVF